MIAWVPNKFEKILSKLFGSLEDPSIGLISELDKWTGDDAISTLEILWNLLLPDNQESISQYAMRESRNFGCVFKFPINALPMHIQKLIHERMYEHLPILMNLLQMPIRNSNDSLHLRLNAWEYFLFWFFTNITQTRKKKVNQILYLSIIEDLNADLINLVIENFEVYLFSKFFLFELEEAKNAYERNLDLYAYLSLEFLLNPINTVVKVNNWIENLRSSNNRKERRFGNMVSNVMNYKGLPQPEPPSPWQMLLIQSTIFIMKNNWRSFLRYKIDQKDLICEGWIGMALFK